MIHPPCQPFWYTIFKQHRLEPSITTENPWQRSEEITTRRGCRFPGAIAAGCVSPQVIDGLDGSQVVRSSTLRLVSHRVSNVAVMTHKFSNYNLLNSLLFSLMASQPVKQKFCNKSRGNGEIQGCLWVCQWLTRKNNKMFKTTSQFIMDNIGLRMVADGQTSMATNSQQFMRHDWRLLRSCVTPKTSSLLTIYSHL